jgi:RNA polymerase sigma factor (sigma-70 family)
MDIQKSALSATQRTQIPVLAALSSNPFKIPGMKRFDLSISLPSAPPARAATGHCTTSSASVDIDSPYDGSSALATSAAADEKILRNCLSAISRLDQLALAKLYDLTVSRVYSVALRIVRHTHLAEEVVSDVYLQVWRDAARYDAERGRVLGWLLIISRSRALDILRRQDEAFSHPEPYELIAEPASSEKTAHELLVAAQDGTALRKAMAALTPLQRQMLSLAFFRGLSHAEIVEHSGIPLGTVKTLIRRALTVLRGQLACISPYDIQHLHHD